MNADLPHELEEFLTCTAEKVILLSFTDCELCNWRETVILVEML